MQATRNKLRDELTVQALRLAAHDADRAVRKEARAGLTHLVAVLAAMNAREPRQATVTPRPLSSQGRAG